MTIEILFILALGMLVLGPKKIPKIAREVGKVMNEVNRVTGNFKARIEEEVRLSEKSDPSKTIEP